MNATNVPGWTSPAELAWLAQQAKRFDSVVEIGAWMGRSTMVLLSNCRGTLITIDNWDVELMRPYGDARKARNVFYRNVENHPNHENLWILEVDSRKAASIVTQQVDMVFIDANHNYSPVLLDILTWLPKTRHLICGHDYSDVWPGVKRAVAEVFGNSFKTIESIWYRELGDG